MRDDFNTARREYAEVNVEVSKVVEMVRTVRDHMASVPKPENLSVKNVIERTLKDVPVPPAVNVLTKLQEPSPVIYADPFDVSKILNHLVANALEVMPDGGTLTFSAHEDASNIEIDVTDTGCGIDEAYVDDFEAATRPKGGHTGWGLRSALRRAEFNDGNLYVTQTSEQGTTFTLRLPRASPDDWEATNDNEPTPSNRVVRSRRGLGDKTGGVAARVRSDGDRLSLDR